MSVSVTYKGSSIASFTNATKTLKTSGTYMEGDVTIEESIASGVVTAPASITATGATVSTGTNTLTLSKTVSVTPSVTTEGYVSSGTAGNSDISLTASVNTRTSSDLTASDDTVTVPAGYYGSQATKAVAAGSAGTPTATKGTVSNNSVSVTPSVTNTAGYISGGTKTGTAVSVSASELVSGNKAITENGSNIDVTNYATVSVDVSGGTAAISVVDTTDTAGGTIRTITALDISDTTAIASDVASGKYFYTAAGVKTQGTASGGGSALATETGTFTGSGGITAQISCDFEPREIYIFGDLSSDVSLRGVVSFALVKDNFLYLTTDSSQNNTTISLGVRCDNITGFNEANSSSEPYATYSNGVLTIDNVENTSSKRFASGVTYSYTLIGVITPTQHTIHLEFSDSTDTDIEVNFDNSVLSTIITAYNPSGEWTYNNKNVVLAQLDNVTWYTYTPIPLNTQLVNYNTCTYGYCVGENGALYEQEWCYVTDYIPIRPTMTFEYRNYYWFYIGFYDESQVAVGGLYVMNDGTQDPNDNNTGYGTLDSTKIPASAKYIRLCGGSPSSTYISLIRTA